MAMAIYFFNGKDITNPTPQELKKLRSDVHKCIAKENEY